MASRACARVAEALALAALAAVTAGACAGGDTRSCPPGPPGVVEVGLGDLDTGFVAIDDGDEVTVVLGPQGLHMVVVSARVYAMQMPPMDATTVRMAVAIRAGGRVVGGTVADVVPASPLEDGARVELLGARAVFTVEDVRALDGVAAELDVVVTDGCGRELRGTRTVTLTL